MRTLTRWIVAFLIAVAVFASGVLFAQRRLLEPEYARRNRPPSQQILRWSIGAWQVHQDLYPDRLHRWRQHDGGDDVVLKKFHRRRRPLRAGIDGVKAAA